MKKRVPVFVLALVFTVIVVLVFIAPHLRLARLEKSLYAATNPEEAATVARVIMKSNSPRATEVIQRYANQNERRAFDSTYGILLLCDETTGEIHEAYLGPQLTVESPGNPSLEKAVRATLQISSKSFSIGQPPKLFKGVHVLSTNETQVDFILNPKAEGNWYRVNYEFARGTLTKQGLYPVSNEELQTWRENQDWPPSWK